MTAAILSVSIIIIALVARDVALRVLAFAEHGSELASTREQQEVLAKRLADLEDWRRSAGEALREGGMSIRDITGRIGPLVEDVEGVAGRVLQLGKDVEALKAREQMAALAKKAAR